MNRNRLTTRKVETAKPGKYEDGDGLRLVVSATGARKWVLRYTRAGKRVEMGLGSLPTVGLADARQKAADARRLVNEGRDPVAVRRAERATAAEGDTFGPFAEKLVDAIETGVPEREAPRTMAHDADDLRRAYLEQAARRYRH